MKKTARKTRTKKATPNSSVIPYIIAGVIILLLIIGAIIYFWPKHSDVAATVNGQPILQSDLEFQYKLLPSEYREAFSQDQVLEQIIDEELVVQAAQRSGVAVSDQDVQERVQQIMAQNSLSANDLQKNLDSLNITQEQFEKLIRRQLAIDRYFNNTFTVSTPDDATLEALYNVSKQQYAIPEQVTVRHILISAQRDDAALIAKRIYDEVRGGADFCALAQNASDDRGSRDTCGLYTFPRGYMTPVFEQAAFNMTPGEIRLVQSEFGYHVIEKINSTPAGFHSFEEARPTLVAQFQSAEHNQQYRNLVSQLRSQATIVYANGTTLLPQTQPSIAAAPNTTVETPVVPDAPNAVNTTLPDTPEPTAEQVDGQALFSCIAAKSMLYGTSWSTETQNARELFARNGVALRYVACDGNVCPNIKAYPTWIIDDRTYLGRLTLDELKNAANC